MSNIVRRDSGASKSRTRRANGAGSVSLRPDGACDVRVSLPGGQRRRRVLQRFPEESKTQFLKRAEATADSMLKATDRGHVLPSGHLTVEVYSQRWLKDESEKSEAGRGLAPSTLNFYRQVFTLYVNPLVGSRPLPQLAIGDVETMMNRLAADGRSARTVQAARNALSRLLKAARREGLVEGVATENASHARRTLASEVGPTTKAMEPEQVKKLLDAAHETRWEPLVATLALLGVRKGEALGLAWSDVDLDQGSITIRRSLSRITSNGHSRMLISPTKTKGSRRVLPLPPVLVAILRTWKVEQTRQRLKVGPLWGRLWIEENLVFTTPIGTPVDPDNLRHALERLGREAGVGHVNPHRLRHSVASVLIASGHTPPEVARILGHSSPSVTLMYYAHAFDNASVRAMSTVSDAFYSSNVTRL
jgi:integrase